MGFSLNASEDGASSRDFWVFRRHLCIANTDKGDESPTFLALLQYDYARICRPPSFQRFLTCYITSAFLSIMVFRISGMMNFDRPRLSLTVLYLIGAWLSNTLLYKRSHACPVDIIYLSISSNS